MANALIEKLRSLSDDQVFEAIASRHLLNNLNSKFSINSTSEAGYSSEQLIVEIISEALDVTISDGLSRLDVATFYHVMVEALDCCG